MSGAALQAAIVAAVREDADLSVLTGVFDAPPLRAALPHAVIEEPVLARWGAAGIDGREGRIAVVLHDGGERPVRLRALAAAVERLGEGLSGALAGAIDDDWQIAGLRLAQTRIARSGGGERWSATISFAGKIYRET